jgi:hypothetical protein
MRAHYSDQTCERVMTIGILTDITQLLGPTTDERWWLCHTCAFPLRMSKRMMHLDRSEDLLSPSTEAEQSTQFLQKQDTFRSEAKRDESSNHIHSKTPESLTWTFLYLLP